MKRTIQHHQRLPESTPPSIIASFGGSLPGKAEIHLRQLTIFGMISRMPGSVLHTHAIQVLVCSNPAAESWFQQIRDLCMQYNLPHPLTTLENPPSKVSYKRIVKSKILDYWEQKLPASSTPTSCHFQDHTKYWHLVDPTPLRFTRLWQPWRCFPVDTSQTWCRDTGPRTRLASAASQAVFHCSFLEHWSTSFYSVLPSMKSIRGFSV